MENQIRSITNDQEIRSCIRWPAQAFSVPDLAEYFLCDEKIADHRRRSDSRSSGSHSHLSQTFSGCGSGGLLLTAAVALSLLTGLLTAAKYGYPTGQPGSSILSCSFWFRWPRCVWRNVSTENSSMTFPMSHSCVITSST